MIEDDEVQIVPPCRVLMKDGKPVDYVIESREPRQGINGTSRCQPLTRPAGQRTTANKPRVGWNRIRNITAEGIADMMAEGKDVSQVAESYKCSESVIYSRLRGRELKGGDE